MFAKTAAILPGGSRRRRSSRDRRPRAGLFSSRKLDRSKKDRRDEDDNEEDLDPASSSSTEESENYHDAKVRAENLKDYEPSELVHGLISESTSGDTSSSEDTAGEQSMEQSVEQSVVYVESEEEDEAGVAGILQMGCMDGFFMPGRAAAARKSLVELNEKGEKELKFNMKLPIAMGFRNDARKEGFENRDTSNQRGIDADGRSSARSFGSVLNCRPDNCRDDHDLQEALEGFSVSSIRQQPTIDPPAKVAGAEPSEQFKSLMSLSHDGSSGDDDSHSNIRAENLVLPPPPPQPPFQMHGQLNYVHGGQQAMMQGHALHNVAGWHSQNMYPPQQQPVTVNNTYEMLVVNGMMPQQQLHQFGHGAQQNYWNYMQNHALPSHRPMEPPAIEKLPSQILVQKEDHTIGEDSSCLSYDNVPAAPHISSTILYQRGQQLQRHHFEARVLQNSHQHPHANAPYGGQSTPMQDSFITKSWNQNHPQNHSSKAHNIPTAISSRSEDSSRQEESDDDFQDSVQDLPEDYTAGKLPKHDDKSYSSASSRGEKPPRVQRWRQANLRRLQGPAPSTSSYTKPPLVPSVPSTGSKSNSPSFDEAPMKQQNYDGVSVASSKDANVLEANGDENDDDETVDSEMAIVDIENIQQETKKRADKPDPGRLQPVQEEDSSTSSDGTSTDCESSKGDESSSSESKACASVASASPLKDEKKKQDIEAQEDTSSKQETVKEAKDTMTSNDEATNEKTTEPGSFLMFDSIYTRRRERRDAAKVKMNKFLESKKAEKDSATNEEGQAVTRTTTRVTRLSRMIQMSNSSSSKDSENSPPKSPQLKQIAQNKDISLTVTPQTENKRATPPPPIETTGSTDAVFQQMLDVPGLNSPAKRSIRGPESPSKRVTMSPLARTASVDNESSTKISLKPTMTSEFHDAFSTASSVESCSSSAACGGDEIPNVRSLHIQPTTTNEWHDAVDTMISPTSAGGVVAAAAAPDDAIKHLEMTMTEELSPVDEPPALSTPQKQVKSSGSSKNPKSSSSSRDEENTSVNVSLKKRSSDHDEYFDATCVVD